MWRCVTRPTSCSSTSPFNKAAFSREIFSHENRSEMKGPWPRLKCARGACTPRLCCAWTAPRPCCLRPGCPQVLPPSSLPPLLRLALKPQVVFNRMQHTPSTHTRPSRLFRKKSKRTTQEAPGSSSGDAALEFASQAMYQCVEGTCQRSASVVYRSLLSLSLVNHARCVTLTHASGEIATVIAIQTSLNGHRYYWRAVSVSHIE